MLEDCPRNYCVAEAELEPLAFVLYSPRAGNSGACYFTWILKRCFIMGKASTTAALVKRLSVSSLLKPTPHPKIKLHCLSLEIVVFSIFFVLSPQIRHA